MKKFKKSLLLVAILVLVLATVFTLSACKKKVKVKSISVSINGEATKVTLAESEATEDGIKGKITVWANLSNDKTEEVTDYTIEGFSASILDDDQEVTIKYGKLSTTVTVCVKSAPVPTDIKVTIASGNKVVLTEGNASEAALRASITVSTVYSDNSTVPCTNYEVQGFDSTKLDVEQTVTIKSGSYSKTIKVVVESASVPVTITGITVTFSGDKVMLDKDSATEAALRAALTVVANKSDNTTEPVISYELEGFDPTVVNQDQSVKVKYEGFEKPITVYIEEEIPQPEYAMMVIVDGDEENAVILTEGTSADKNALKEYSGKVDLKVGESVVVKDNRDNTFSDYEPESLFKGTATVDGAHTFYVKIYEDGSAIYVELPENVTPPQGVIFTVKGGESQTLTENDQKPGEYMLLGQQLKEGDVVIITFNGEIVNYDPDCGFGGTVKLAGEYNFYVTEEKIWVDPWAALIVNGEVVAVFAEDMDGMPEGTKEQYSAVADLEKDDVVVVKDISGKIYTFENLEDGVITMDGVYRFYLKISVEGASSVYARFPKYATLSVNGGEAKRLVLNEENEDEYMLIDEELEEGDKIVITMDGKTIPFNPACGFDGTVKLAGKYSFYLSIPNEMTWVGKWIALIVNDEIVTSFEEHTDGMPEGTVMQYRAMATLEAYDVVVVKDTTGKVHPFENLKNGIATLDGDYIFYLKVAEDESTIVYVKIPKYATISVDGGEEKKLVPNEENEDEYMLLGEELDEGSEIVVKLNGQIVPFDPACGFTGTVKISGKYNFYVSENKVWVDPWAAVLVGGKVLAVFEKSESDLPAGVAEQYTALATLKAEDVVVIKDTSGKVYKFENLEDGIAPSNGDYRFYLKINSDETSSVYVRLPINIKLTVNGEERELTVNEENDGEYMLLGEELEEGAKIFVTINGNPAPYKTGCRFNGTVKLAGNYDFYIDSEGIWVTYWMQITVERGGKVINTVIPEKHLDGLDEAYADQYKGVIGLQKGDKVTIKDIAGAVFAEYENADTFNGTATEGGEYTLFIKLGKVSTDDKIWTDFAPATENGIKVAIDGEKLTLIGKNATKAEILKAITVTVQMSDGSEKILENKSLLEITGFDASDKEDQNVTITYNKFSDEIIVKVEEAAFKAIEVAIEGGAAKVEMEKAHSAEADIKALLTVTRVLTDGTTEIIKTYTLKGYDPSKEDTNQLVTVVVAEGEESQITVVVLGKQVKSISVSYKSGNKVVLLSGDVSAEAIRAQITVDATLEDDSVLQDVAAYTLSAVDAEILNEVQKITLTYREKDAAVDVEVQFYISLFVGEEETLFVDGECFVDLKAGDKMIVKDTSGKQYSFAEADSDIADCDGSYTLTFTGSDHKVVVERIPAASYQVGKGEEVVMLSDGTAYKAVVSLAEGDALIVRHNGKSIALTEEFSDGKALYSGRYTLTLANGVLSVSVQYAATIQVNDEDPIPLKLNEKADADKTEYMLRGLALKEKDVVVITLDGVEVSNYKQDCMFNGTVAISGNYDFYIAADGLYVSSWFALLVNNETVAVFKLMDKEDTPAEAVAQYRAAAEIKAGSTMVVKDTAGDIYPLQNVEDGKATLNGIYVFYLKFYPKNPANVWVDFPAENPDPAPELTIGSGAPQTMVANLENIGEYMLQGVNLTAGQKITIKQDGETLAYRDDCAFNGTVYLTGKYDFYVSGKTIWVTYWMQLTVERDGNEIGKFGAELHNEGLTDTDIKEQYRSIVTLQKGDVVKIRDISGTVFATYQNDDTFNGTAAAGGEYTLYIKVGYESKDNRIWTNFVPATAEVLIIKIEGEQITLVGQNATTANILKAMDVTVKMSDGSLRPLEDKSVLTIKNFRPGNTQSVQEVLVVYEELEETVAVKVEEAAFETIEVIIDGGASKVELDADHNTENDIRSKITSVSRVLTDGSSSLVKSYTLKGFDPTVEDKEQTVTVVVAEGEEAEITVIIIGKKVEEITVQYKEGTKVVLKSGDVSESAIRAQIIVNATMDDKSVMEDVSAYTLSDVDGKIINNVQKITVFYREGKTTIDVEVLYYIAVFVGETETQFTDGTCRVDLKAGDEMLVKDTSDVAISFAKEGANVADCDGVYTLTITGTGAAAKVSVVRVPAASYQLGEEDEVVMLADGENYQAVVTIAEGETLVVKHNGKSVALTKDFEDGKALYSGRYTLTLANGVLSVSVEYASTIVVNNQTIIPLKYNFEGSEYWKVAEYIALGLPLTAGDTVVVTWYGKELVYKPDCWFDGTVVFDHEYNFYVREEGVWVDKVFALYVNDQVAAIFRSANDEKFPDIEQYRAAAEMKKDDVAMVKDSGGNVYTFENLPDGKATNGGVYAFYLKFFEDGSSTVWVGIPEKELGPAPLFTVGSGAPITMVANLETPGEFMLQGVELVAGQTVSITRSGKPVAYKTGCSFNGIVKVTGNYDFYVDDNGIWVGYFIAIIVERNGEVIKTVVSEQHLDGLDEKTYDDQYKGVIVLQQGDVITVKDIAGTVFAKYEEPENFNGTALQGGEYTLYIKMGIDSKDDVIYAKIVPATPQEIHVSIDGEKITLIGKNATEKNIIAAITVMVSMSDGGTYTLPDKSSLEVSDFDPTDTTTNQLVTITYGELTDTVLVKVEEAVFQAIEVAIEGGASKVELDDTHKSEDDIRSKITSVTRVLTDGTTETILSYTLNGFDATASGDQNVTVVVAEGEEAEIIVIIISHQVKSISASYNKGTKVVLLSGDVSVEAIRAQITVDATLDDAESTIVENVTSYTLSDVDASKTNQTQQITVTYRGETTTIDVEILYYIALYVDGEETVFENGICTVQLKAGDTMLVKDTSDAELTFAVEGSNVAACDGAYTLTIIGATRQISVECTPAAAYKIGKGVEEAMSADGANYKAVVNIAEGEALVVKHNGTPVALTAHFDEDGLALYSGEYTLTLANGVLSVSVQYAATIKINNAAAQPLKLNTKAANEEYMLDAVALKANDVVVITFKGDVVNNYNADTLFNGTVALDGEYSFYVAANGIYVSSWYELLVNNKQIDAKFSTTTNDDPNVSKQFKLVVELKKDDVVSIMDTVGNTGDAEFHFESMEDKKAPINGFYTFYIKLYNSNTKGVWVTVPTSEPGPAPSLQVGNGTQQAMEVNPENVSEYMLIGVEVAAGQTVVITRGSNVVPFQEACNFNGTAVRTGFYNFYVGDDGVWVDNWVSLDIIRDSETIQTILPERHDDNFDTSTYLMQLMAVINLKVGDSVVIKDMNNVAVATYENVTVQGASNFNGTATEGGEYTLYIKLGKQSKDNIIWADFAPAVEKSIEVSVDGLQLNLIGQNATAENIIAAITITVTMSDGSDFVLADKKDVTVSGFTPNYFEKAQSVGIHYHGFSDTVLVKVDAAVFQAVEATVLAGGTKVELDSTHKTEADIKAKIKVERVLTDGDRIEVSVYTLANFDDTLEDEDQTVTVAVADGESTTITVIIIGKKVQNIAANYNEGTKVVLKSGDVSESAIRAQIIVNATMDDTSVMENVSAYTLSVVDANKTNQTQQITVTYRGKTTTIDVEILYYISLFVDNDEKAVLENNTCTLQLKCGNVMSVMDTSNVQIAFATEGAEVADCDGTYTLTITGTGANRKVAVTRIPAASYIVGEEAEAIMLADGENYKAVVSLEEGDALVVKHNGTAVALTADFDEDGLALYSGEYTLTLVNGVLSVSVEYAATLQINSEDPIPLKRNMGAKDKVEYMILALELDIDDEVVVVMDGDELEYKDSSAFQGKAHLAGECDFYISAEGIWVSNFFAIVVEREEAVVATHLLASYTTGLDTTTFADQFTTLNDEKQPVGITLRAGDEVTIKDVGGNTYSAYSNTAVFNGTATAGGTYTIFVKFGKSAANNQIVTEFLPATVQSVSVAFAEGSLTEETTLILPGAKAYKLGEALIVTAHMSDGTDKITKDYKPTGYNSGTINAPQPVTISYGGKSTIIYVKVVDPSAIGISVELTDGVIKEPFGKVILLIGAQATEPNILAAISVTANMNDGTTRPDVVCTVKTGTFSGTTYGSKQDVTIQYKGLEATVPVFVTAATRDYLLLAPASISVTGADETEVLAAIRNKLVVKIVMTDETASEPLTETEYEINLDDFDYEVFGTAQSVSITVPAGEHGSALTAILSVQLLKEPKAISTNYIEGSPFSILQSQAGEDSRLAALKASGLTVSLILTDNSTTTISDYEVDFGASFDTTSSAPQTVTISYGSLESQEIEVQVVLMPTIKIGNGAATYMNVDAQTANKYISGDITLQRGQNVTIFYNGSELTYTDGKFDGTADLNGTYSFAVTVSGATATVASTVPAYAPVLKIGDIAQSSPAVSGNTYTWVVNLAIGEKLTMSDNRVGDLIFAGENSEYTATRSGEHTVVLTAGTTASIAVTQPNYAAKVTIQRNGAALGAPVAMTLVANSDTAKYSTTEIDLLKGDVAIVTDNEGNTHSNYDATTLFSGAALIDGRYIFHLIVDDGTATVDVDVPYYGTLKAGDTVIALQNGGIDGTTRSQQYTGKITLAAGQEVEIRDMDNNLISNRSSWDNSTEHIYEEDCAFAGTALFAGEYTFYVKFPVWDPTDNKYVGGKTIWVNFTPAATDLITIFYRDADGFVTDDNKDNKDVGYYAYHYPLGGDGDPVWPGERMQYVINSGWYGIQVSATHNMVIFNNGIGYQLSYGTELTPASGKTLAGSVFKWRKGEWR